MEINSIGGWVDVKKGPDRRTWFYTCTTLTGIAAVLLSGTMLSGTRTTLMDGQVQDSASQTLEANAHTQVPSTAWTTSTLSHSPAPTSIEPIAIKGMTERNIHVPYKKGEKVTLSDGLPLFSGPKDHRTATDQMKITHRTSRAEKYTFAAVQGEWIKIKTKEQDGYWLPGWYVLKQSRSMTETSPRTFNVRTGSKLHLTPDSTAIWPSSQAKLNEALIVAEWKEWYGVTIAPRNWKTESSDYHHVLLWIRKTDITDQTPVTDGWFTREQPLSLPFIQLLADTKLSQATTSKQAVKWLGEPDWKEHSRNMKDTGYTMQLGQTWRYERQDAHLLLTFNPKGRLIEMRWNKPADPGNGEPYYRDYGRFDVFSYTTEIAGRVLPQTLPWKPEWVNQGDLNYTFLQAGTEDVLLMKGDDGGFSGMHFESSYYALNRHTGQLLWRIHSGAGLAQAFINNKRDAVTLFTSYDTDHKEYRDRVRHIGLKDGKLRWEYKHEALAVKGIKTAQDVVIVDSSVADGSTNGRIHVLNSSNGKRLWSKKLTTGYRLLNRSADEPYVLYWDQDQLTAADPMTGRIVWQIEAAQSSEMSHIENNSYFDGVDRYDPFGTVSLERWMPLDHQWVLLDLNSGKKLSQFPVHAGQELEVLNDGMVLIRDNQKGDQYGDYEDFRTSLFDPKTGELRWTRDVKLQRGLVEGEQLYIIMNGYPAAVDYRTGKTRWSAKRALGSAKYTTNQGSYLIIGDRLLLPLNDDLLVMHKREGTLLGCVHDVVMGTPEHRDREAKNGMINQIGNKVYIGSANGRFRVLPASGFEGEILP
ncbi:outer membrane protein assembly factor BamB [Paenibacillus barcinonensis]|uniref:Outer membrane protein assembly factor BamB n=1 Tax=Paenibacillus barcinonensis TaxID=198119 RepID=A0A2V4UU44_PAEBA|nr:outer membrane protein assembly factor BamB [Paenibacillus barcinonensis]